MTLATEEWHVSYDMDSDEATATVHLPPCHHMRVEVATVDCLAMEEVDGDMEVVREGPDAWRLQNVCLIAHAPDLLQAVREANRQLAAICDGDIEDRHREPWETSEDHLRNLNDHLNTEENWELWRFLSQIQDDLARAADEAVNLDTI